MADKKNNPPQTRRKFIKRTVMGMAAGVGAAALSVGAREARAESLAGKWSKETDVVIIGSGVGGCASALAAREAGASVLVLEKAPKLFFGGNSSIAGGNFYASPPEKFYRKLMEMSAGRSDETAARTLADNAEAAVKWLGAAGVGLDWAKRKGYAVGPKRGKGVMKNPSTIATVTAVINLISNSRIQIKSNALIPKAQVAQHMEVCGCSV